MSVSVRLIAPPKAAIVAAVDAGSRSPCAKSKRGVVIWHRAAVVSASSGHNAQPPGFECDGSVECRANCGKLCEHAEASALRSLASPPHLHGVRTKLCDMVHAKVIDGELVPSGPPSCWQCSRAILADGRIGGVWLVHEAGWRRYGATEFHRLTLETCGLARSSQ